MSILRRNRASSLSLLRSSKPASGSRTRRTSFSFADSKFGSLPSCPALTTPASSEQEFGISKRARATSAPFIKRKGDFAGRGQAHGDYCLRLRVSSLLPSQPATLSKPLSGAPCKKPTQDTFAEGVQTAFSALPYHTADDRNMPKAPQLSFRSPISSPKMLAIQPGVHAPIAKSPLSPKISFSAMLGLLYDCRPLAAAHSAAIAAVLQPQRRSPPPGSRPALRIECSTEDEHVLSVCLPGFEPEMVTVYARREDKLAVVADLWHAETNCHHEWLVSFSSRDANVQQTRAQFSADGTLTIHVPRRNVDFYWMTSQLR